MPQHSTWITTNPLRIAGTSPRFVRYASARVASRGASALGRTAVRRRRPARRVRHREAVRSAAPRAAARPLHQCRESAGRPVGDAGRQRRVRRGAAAVPSAPRCWPPSPRPRRVGHPACGRGVRGRPHRREPARLRRSARPGPCGPAGRERASRTTSAPVTASTPPSAPSPRPSRTAAPARWPRRGCWRRSLRPVLRPGRTFTDVGHATALVLGVAMGAARVPSKART